MTLVRMQAQTGTVAEVSLPFHETVDAGQPGLTGHHEVLQRQRGRVERQITKQPMLLRQFQKLRLPPDPEFRLRI